MSEVPANLKYAKSHEWLKPMDDGTCLIGITEHAQDQLGDMVFVEVPDVGRKLAVGEACAVVESVKAASDVYSPIGGEVVESNQALADAPELLNQSPYDQGWLMRLRPSNPADVNALLDSKSYAALIAEE